MCQIIALKAKDSDCLANTIFLYEENFRESLEEKGEDYFSASLIAKKEGESINLQFSALTSEEMFKMLKTFLDSDDFFRYTDDIGVILFSRQKPEMEVTHAEEQPYKIKDGFIAIHGTIINDQELADAAGMYIVVDTEVFKEYDIGDPRIKGTYACIQLTEDVKILTRINGLKIWEENVYGSYVTVTSTGNLDYLRISRKEEPEFQIPRKLMVAFSGGMDIAFSTYKAVKDGNYSRVILNYFDWGSRAADAELATLHNFVKYYSNALKIPVELNVINCGEYFDDFFNIAGVRSKIADAEAVGDSAETEAPIAYVPFRNTQFAMILASIAEGKEYQNVDILFGLNLSEGMVFMDNSEGWLEAITSVIQYGGKDYSITGCYKVIAPYFSRTKTNMLKEFKEEFGPMVFQEILDTSFSCYYPNEDGTPCGKCGSCILREKALSTLEGD